MEIVGFIFFLVLFVSIGLFSARQASEEGADYLLAGRTVSPVLTALSAAATKNSGYMFIGLMGYVYTHGLSAIWLVFGFFFGDLVAYTFVHKRLRAAAEDTGALSFAELLGRWNGGDYKRLRAVVGLVTLVFLTTYAAAQFNSGGKALHVLFDWHYNAGAIIGAGLILVYCFVGGLRASIWTDAGQSILMMGAMWLLLFAAISGAGGWSGFTGQLDAISPTYLDFGSERFGGVGAMLLFGFGWLFNGLGVTGQPQVMVRFMALDDTNNTRKTGIYYFVWTGVFLASTFVVGLATRLYIGGEAGFDAELALPTLAGTLLPGMAVGVVIGGVFAAAMSTTDSQVLSCSAVLSEDFKLAQGVKGKRIATLIVTVSALLIGIFASANVFTLVIFAWSALACSIGPLVIIHALGRRPAEWVALTMMAVGLSVALLWREFGLTSITYEGLPGIGAALLTYWILSGFSEEAKRAKITTTN
jgi:sodium/proline symporter